MKIIIIVCDEWWHTAAAMGLRQNITIFLSFSLFAKWSGTHSFLRGFCVRLEENRFTNQREKKKVKYNSRRKALNQRENESKNLPDVYLYSWQYSLRKLLAQTLFCFSLSMFSLEHDSINELGRNFLFVSYSTFYFGW